MKTKAVIGTMIIFFIILLTNIAFAATGTVEIKTDATKLKKGETFTITLSATSEDGINGIDTKYIYDSEKLELVSESLIDTSKWTNIGNSSNITIICNSTETIKKADIYAIKFKVKDNVTVGDKLKVETSDILLDTDLATNSEVSIQAKKLEFEVIEGTISSSDETSKQVSQNTSNKEITNISAKSNNTNQSDSTTATEILPKTGANILIILSIFIVIILSIVFYQKYMQNKDAK